MYDRNGLELTPVQTSLNAYKYTAVNVKGRDYTAYAQAARNRGIYSMVTIAKFDDARDAAFIGQEFAKKYTVEQVYEMVLDKSFSDVAERFVEDTEIPEWQYPAEGLDWDDILGNSDKKNRVADAKDALVEALKISKKKTPVVTVAKQMVNEVDTLYKQGMSYRAAAKIVTDKY